MKLIRVTLLTIFFVSICSIVWSPVDGQVAVESSQVLNILVPEKFGVLSGLIFVLISARRIPSAISMIPNLLWVLIFWIYLSSLWGIDAIEVAGRSTSFFMTVLVSAVAISTFGAAQSLSLLWRFTATVLLVSLVVAASGSPYGLMANNHAGLWRGVFVHKNHFGVVVSFFLLMNIFNLGGVSSLYRLISSGVAIFLIWMSGSSTAIVLPILAIAYRQSQSWISLLRVRNSIKSFSYTLLLGSFFSFTWFLQSTVLEALNRDVTLTGRSQLWASALAYAIEHPWGAGYRTGGGTEALNAIRIGSGWLVAPSAHNGYLSLLLDTGLLGVFVWTLWLVIVISSAKGRNQALNVYGGALGPTALAVAANAQVDSAGGAYATYATFLFMLLYFSQRHAQKIGGENFRSSGRNMTPSLPQSI